MKNIFKFSALLACLAMIGLASCTQEELSTDQYSDGAVAFSAFGPNPVVRGDTLTILGSNLEKVKEVRLPGVDPVTEFAEVVAGPKGQLKVVVPVEGPEDAPVTGVVSIVDQNGTVFSSTTELTYTEGIKITSIAPTEVLPGDIVTIKGDYLYNTREVVFVSGNKDGKSYITIYYGADVTEKQAQKTADLFAEICPDADVNLLNGGQPVYYYLISAE